NDTFGHDVGDLVLIEVVQKTKGNIRQTDSLYRTGGEEFIILTPNTDQEQAGILANKVRQAIEKHDFETVGRVTVSLGCAQFDKKNEDSTEQMLKRADQALYRAKEGGRNQVIIAD
ncbi:MAG: GGDEF domain-containing protein, partial [Nitrospina sp.]|nr:GGDEF domain-containing protein [Nitrospina sp.]